MGGRVRTGHQGNGLNGAASIAWLRAGCLTVPLTLCLSRRLRLAPFATQRSALPAPAPRLPHLAPLQATVRMARLLRLCVAALCLLLAATLSTVQAQVRKREAQCTARGESATLLLPALRHTWPAL